MIYACCVLLIINLFDLDKQVDIHAVKEQYAAESLKARSAYNNLLIAETMHYLTYPNSPVIKREGSICGEYVTQSGIHGTTQYAHHHFLTPRSILTMNYQQDTGVWTFVNYARPANMETYQAWKSKLLLGFPETFTLPFETINGHISINDIFDGKFTPKMKESMPCKITLTKVVRVVAQGRAAFRLHFVLDYDSVSNPINYVDVVPELSWMIVKGRMHVVEWDIQYGNKINNTYVIRTVVIQEPKINEETGMVEMMPTQVYQVDKAEALNHVNSEIYEPAYYGVDVEGQNFKRISVSLLMLGVLGIFIFMVGRIVIERARRHARLAIGKEA